MTQSPSGASSASVAFPGQTTEEPTFAFVYGRGGTTKSTALGALMAGGGIALAPPTGMEPVRTFLAIPMVSFAAHEFAAGLKVLPELFAKGYFVVFRPDTLGQALSWLVPLREVGAWGVGFDDVSLFAQDALLDLKVQYQGAKNKFAMYGEVHDLGAVLRRLATSLSLAVVINGHEKDRTENNETSGPDMPSRGMAGQLFHGAAFVVRATFDNRIEGTPKAAHILRDPRGLWDTKSRILPGVPPEVAPANLRSVLHASGRRVPRMRGLEWQDAVMAWTAGQIVDGKPYDVVMREGMQLGAARGWHPAHIAWALRDGYGLAYYQQHQRNAAANYLEALLGTPKTILNVLPGMPNTDQAPPSLPSTLPVSPPSTLPAAPTALPSTAPTAPSSTAPTAPSSTLPAAPPLASPSRTLPAAPTALPGLPAPMAPMVMPPPAGASLPSPSAMGMPPSTNLSSSAPPKVAVPSLPGLPVV